jgi:hypothetical protein
MKGSTTSGSAAGRRCRFALAQTTSIYNAAGELTSQVAPDGNLAEANAGNYTTVCPAVLEDPDGEQIVAAR